MANEVKIKITGQDMSKAAYASAIANQQKLEKGSKDFSNTATNSYGRAGKAVEGMKGAWEKGAVAVAGFTVAAGVANKMMNDGIAHGMANANAQVALGTTGFNTLSTAAKNNANAMGLTKQEFIAAGGQAASLAKNMGFTQEAAAKFGILIPDLANKLSFMSNGSRDAAESSDMLRSAIAGEFDPLQSVGINISANIVKQKALSIQTASTTQMSDQQANALAVLSIVQEQTAGTTAAMATEQGKAAIKVAENNARMRESWQDLEDAAAPFIGKTLGEGADQLNSYNNVAAIATDSTSSFKDKMEGAANLSTIWNPLALGLGLFKKGSDDAGDSAAQSATDITALGQGAQSAAASQQALAEATQNAVAAIKEQANVALGGYGAAINYQEAIDNATESLKENGKTLDITTPKGRANKEALLGIASAAIAQADAIRDAGGTEEDYQASLEGSRAQLIKAATQMGMNKQQANALATSIFGIPTKHKTDVYLDKNGAVQHAKDIIAWIGRINGKTVHVNIQQTTFRSVEDIGHSRGEHAYGGIVGSHAAAGGPRSNEVLVGEMGPEIVNLAPGSSVTPAGATQARMGQMGGGGDTYNFYFPNYVGSKKDITEAVRESVGRNGGNVQKHLGS